MSAHSNRGLGVQIARHHGVSMIEVLIAMLLVAIGTLAIVALQLSSKRSNMDAAQRSLAAQIGYGFMERIRGNNTAEGLAAYQTAAGTDPGFGGGQQATPVTNCGAGVDCGAAELAAYDAWQFEQELDGAGEQIGGSNVGGLINPVACLSATPPGGVSATFTLTIVWRGTGALPNNTAVTCGQGLPGDPYGAADEFRRTLTLNTFIVGR